MVVSSIAAVTTVGPWGFLLVVGALFAAGIFGLITGLASAGIGLGKLIADEVEDEPSDEWGYKPTMYDPMADTSTGGLLEHAAYGQLQDPSGAAYSDLFRKYGNDALGGTGHAHDARLRQQQAMDLMRQRAEGRVPSIAQAQTQQSIAQAQRQAQSQLASTPGGYNPMAARAAQYASADAASRLGAQGSIAAAKERLAAEGMYGKMSGQAYGQELLAERQRADMAARYRAMGYGAAAADRAARQRLNADRMRLHQAQLSPGLQQQQSEQKREDDRWNRFTASVANMGAMNSQGGGSGATGASAAGGGSWFDSAMSMGGG